MEELILQLVSYEVGIVGPGSGNPQAEPLYVSTVVDFCLKLGRRYKSLWLRSAWNRDWSILFFNSDLLFGAVYETLLRHKAAVGLMLENLATHIVAGRLQHVTPTVMQHLVEHFRLRGMLRDVEQCIVCLDIASLDIHQVSKILPNANLLLKISLEEVIQKNTADF